MEISHASVCIDVIEAFTSLSKALGELNTAILQDDAPLPSWFKEVGSELDFGFNKREHVVEFINQLEYRDSQHPKEIIVGAGLVASSQNTLDKIEAVNQAKLVFKEKMLLLRRLKIDYQNEVLINYFEKNLDTRPEGVSNILSRMGLARLHLKQTYRLIPYFRKMPHSVSWTGANTRAIKKITAKQAVEMLAKNTKDQGMRYQMELAAKLDPNEQLAIVQELAPHLRANLVFKESDNSKVRKMIKGAMPIFFLSQGGFPEFKPVKEKTGKSDTRAKRSDVKIAPEPYLPALRAHRYEILE